MNFPKVRLGQVVVVLWLALVVGLGGKTAATPVPNCNDVVTQGGDDVAYQLPLDFPLLLGETLYETIYLTTNGTLTFGAPDATYWDYPNTPSVSVAGYDWATWGDGAHLSYGWTGTIFCAEWAVRPWPQSTGELTIIRLVINANASNGSWTGEITTEGWLPEQLRRGIRYLPNEPIVPVETSFSVGESGVPETTIPETTLPETTLPETTIPSTTTTLPEPSTTIPEPSTTVPTTTLPPTTTTLPPSTPPSAPEPPQEPSTTLPAPVAPPEGEEPPETPSSESDEVLAEATEAYLDLGLSPELAAELAQADQSPAAAVLGPSTVRKVSLGVVALEIVVTPIQRLTVFAVGGALIFAGSGAAPATSTRRRIT